MFRVRIKNTNTIYLMLFKMSFELNDKQYIDTTTARAEFYLFTDNNCGGMCNICSALTTKTQERRQWHLSGTYIVNFK